MPEIADSYAVDDVELEAGVGKSTDLEDFALASYERHVLDNHDAMRELRQEGLRNQRFQSPLGDQWDEEVRKIFKQIGIPEKGINQTWPAVTAMTNRERTDRYIPKFTGRQGPMQRWADAVNTINRWIRDMDDQSHTDSQAFKQAMIQRVGAIAVHVDAWSDRVPQIKMVRVPLSELLLDFYCDKVNLQDMGQISRGRWMNWREFKSIYANSSEKWKELVEVASGGSADFDTGDIWTRAIGLDGTTASFYRRREREIFVVDHYWKEGKRIIELDLPGEVALLWQQAAGAEIPMDLPADPDLWGQIAQLTIQAEQMREQMMQQAQQDPEAPPPPMAEPIIREVDSEALMYFKTAYVNASGQDYNDYFDLKPETVYHAVIVGKYVVRVQETRDRNWGIFPLVPFLDDEPDQMRPYSYVDLIKPRQQWLNQFLALWIHTMAHMTKAQIGIDLANLEEGEIDDINNRMARGDGAIPIRGGKDSIFPWPKGSMPDGIEQAWQVMLELVPGGGGASAYSLGTVSDLRRTASSLVTQQVAATEGNVAEAYDALGLLRKQLARKNMGMAFAWMSRDQIVELAGEYGDAVPMDPSQFRSALQMQVKVGEEISTKDMSQTAIEAMNQTGQWQAWMDLAPKALIEAQAPIMGSSFREEALEGIRLREPQAMMEKLAEMYGLDPEMLQQAVEQIMPQEGTA